MTELDLILSGYDYELPSDRIAQNPVIPRDSSRLLVVKSAKEHAHHIFQDLPTLLEPGDLLILNNTRVIPARLYGHKSTGAAVEVLLLSEKEPNCWLALVKPGRRLPIGAKIVFTPLVPDENREVLTATVIDKDWETGGRLLKFDLPPERSLLQILDLYGHIPFPPYVTDSAALPEQYQTVYAEKLGAIAAPTAGLHFTDDLFAQLDAKGINRAFVTLHVGVGTFRPVEVEDITNHQMHHEWVEISQTTVDKIRETKANGGRIIAVGTTVVRSLEGVVALSPNHNIEPYCGQVNLFIYPGYQWRLVQGLITNFHLPRSSLLMLVSALISRQRLLDLYQEAINLKYRFYSFGDAMLILPQN